MVCPGYEEGPGANSRHLGQGRNSPLPVVIDPSTTLRLRQAAIHLKNWIHSPGGLEVFDKV